MKFYRKALIPVLSMLLGTVAFAASGCGAGNSSQTSAADKNSASTATTDEADSSSGLAELGIDPGSVGVFPDVKHDANHIAGFQLEPPKEGDTVAVIHTTMGDITMRFFPDQAPKAVTNFINLSENGSYSKTSFHKVVKDFTVQGGHCGTDENSPNGISSFGGMFEDEFCDSLLNLRGAVSMANSTKDSNGSQFFINQTTPEAFEKSGGWNALNSSWDNIKSTLQSYKDSNLLSAYIEENGDKFLNPAAVPENVKKLYTDNGGNPTLDGAYNAADRGNTVFGQVVSGMDVVDKIAAAEVDDKYVPKKRIQIESIEITTYAEPKADK